MSKDGPCPKKGLCKYYRETGVRGNEVCDVLWDSCPINLVTGLERVEDSPAFVYVEYLDHTGNVGHETWLSIEAVQAYQPALIASVGFLIKEDKDFIVLVSDWGAPTNDREPELGHPFTVLKSTIRYRQDFPAIRPETTQKPDPDSRIPIPNIEEVKLGVKKDP